MIRSIWHLLESRFAEARNRTVYQFVDGSADDIDAMTVGELHERARAIGAWLQQQRQAGERVILLLPPGKWFVAAFFGCLAARAVAVPCYPPFLTRASLTALMKIARNCGANVVLSVHAWATDSQLHEMLGDAARSVRWLAVDRLDSSLGADLTDPDCDGRTLAFLQYTSGSTGDPKGVMVTHGNLLANLECISGSFSLTESDRVCSWLPPYHDMGLIGGILSGLYNGYVSTLIPPARFMRDPLLWLRVLTATGATATGAPNFAYDRCVQAAKSARSTDLGLDLGRIEIAFSGAEMVRIDTMERFVEQFGRYGFRRSSFLPCYGLAEATLLCACRRRGTGPRGIYVDRKQLGDHGRVVEVPADSGWQVASCGPVAVGQTLRIVDPETRQARPDGCAGEIWVRGPSVSSGYWQAPEATSEAFDATIAGSEEGGWLRTGDRGFIHEGQLYIVGRDKDIVVSRGRNYAATDIESSVRLAHEAIKPHRCLALADDSGSQESLVVLFECSNEFERTHDAAGFMPVLEAVRRRVVADHGLVPDVIAAVASGRIPVTTSGKLQRELGMRGYQDGTLKIRARLVTAPQERDEAEPLAQMVADVQQLLQRFVPGPFDATARLGELGLDSIKATELAAKLSDHFGVELSAFELGADTTIESLARRIASTPGAAASGSRVEPAPAPLGSSGPDRGSSVRAEPVAATSIKSGPLQQRIVAHQAHIQPLRDTGLLGFHFVQGGRGTGIERVLDGAPLQMFSSYSYLGLGDHPEIVAAKVAAIQRFGTGADGVMLLGGYTELHRRLEAKLAHAIGCEDALLYSSGYLANLAAIDSLVDRDGVIYCDILIHTSLLDGCRLSGATVRTFPHQDADALDRMLARRKSDVPAVILVDGVYSLRGDIAALPQLVAVARRHSVPLLVDDAHGLGAIGLHGYGSSEHHGVRGRVDVVTGGLGKGIPAFGGFVGGSHAFVDYLRFRSRPYVYSGGMDPANVACALRALELLREQPALMERLRSNIASMAELLDAARIPSLRSGSPCMPVVCRDDTEAFLLAREMRQRGFYVAPITYPAVPRHEQGLRLTVTAAHTYEQIAACVHALDEAFRSIRLTPKNHQTSLTTSEAR